ncbi:hypothetical protein KEM48_014006 [Puccinia striiformis f. sp. tritici PST-130]|uniref:Uncharacterized protein n=1 Tax=Puccinia striiformis f. sp. tritici PST-78 TaxID=1165861 RepID=A0A0L0VH12_9BASI|nr:hypothetical protein KEM48_014006 [Puccinia striiformis f. sp. tritici PST-130]KNE98538.1 hypothetical protein PSTG_08277 [Puccinia striiformis f. sp. tritici PST-78]
MTPKGFMFHFVSSENSKITYLRRYWSTITGVKGAMNLVRALSDEIKETPLRRSLWKDLIQEQLTTCCPHQRQQKSSLRRNPPGDFTRTEAPKPA